MKSFSFSVLIILIVAFSNCSKEKTDILNNTWKVEKIQSAGDLVWLSPQTNKSYFLSFKNRKVYNLKMDCNNCSGQIKFSGKNSLKFGGFVCTLMACGDTTKAFDYKLPQLILGVNSYQINGTELSLEGEGGVIILSKQH